MVRVHDEERFGQAAHFAQTAEARLQFGHLAREQERFFLDQFVEIAGRLPLFEFEHIVNARADRAKVGERAAEPALGDVRHPAAQRFGLHRFLRLAFRADEENHPALRGGIARKVVRFLQFAHRLLEVNDVNAVAFGEDERAHLGIPAPRAVSKVDAGFQQRLHW